MTAAMEKLKTLLALYQEGKNVKNKIIGHLNKHKYGFVPKPGEANTLQRIDKSEAFSRLKYCIGKHPLLNLIKVGIYITELNDSGERELIKKTKMQISKKYGPRGMKIIHLGTTGVILDVIGYLDSLKVRKEYGSEYIVSEFERILDNWEKISLFVKSKHDTDELYLKLCTMMGRKHNIFFVFAYGEACSVAMSMISEMNNSDKITQGFNYLFWVKPGKDKAGMVKFTWEFEYCPPN